MTKYRCMRDCQWQGHLWREGQEYEGTETPPHHFKAMDEGKAPAKETKKEPAAEKPAKGGAA